MDRAVVKMIEIGGIEKSGNKTLFKGLFYEFHIAAAVRKKYKFDELIFSINGNVIFADFKAVRSFVNKINSHRNDNEKVYPGYVNGYGLLDEIYHYLLREYEEIENPKVFDRALKYLSKNVGESKLNKILSEFVKLFPPTEVYKKNIDVFDYLNSFTGKKQNYEVVLEELILLYFANVNPAAEKIKELFDQNYFSDIKLLNNILKALDDFFQKEKAFGPDMQDIFTFFKTPFIKHPDNLEEQLDFIQKKWGILLKDKFSGRILSGKDLMKEDFVLGAGGGGTPTIVPKYKSRKSDEGHELGKSGYKYELDEYSDYEEPENFTPDIPWMPNVVLLAKNIYVWLDQLSKKYERNISRLDQIPDEELDELVRRNFTGLWLIGIWERSHASKRIKHIMGNIDAVASAYSLYDYQIASDIGGEEAYRNLNERANARGLRLASDMVPNHTAIDSKWMKEHPEYFIQSDYSPFPSYKFTGEDLSEDSDYQIRIEDGYWSRSDAAVVLQRIDNRTGQAKYIYHGNDGTNMPWNDTAQLNLLREDVREAVIQKIMDVARKFSIIRFDAAMTLTKRHFSRLWFPQPGKGGDIPSRTDYALSKSEFDKLFPKEFWREVVNRINNELPETLLLAEAFWLMEGYFVRSLGMHRVYNSAFMNMLMREENEKYRELITNTLEFEPEILKRYVNFMSNPDEETAIKQFGTDDKYFGVCVLMVTLPGLPMFAHGQVEGYTEKYGMEYKRAYYNESPNDWLVQRHEREIFPLMEKRYLFSQVNNFWYYDFQDDYGNINSNVFAYSNSEWGERAIVLFNNKYESAAGYIFRSVPKLVSTGRNKKELMNKTVGEALNFNGDVKVFYIFREQISGLEYLIPGRELVQNGIRIFLGGFKYKVFLDFREVYDNDGKFEQLYYRIGDDGVHGIESAIEQMKLEPIHEAIYGMFDEAALNSFINNYVLDLNETSEEEKLLHNKYYFLLTELKNHYEIETDVQNILDDFDKEIKSVKILNKKLKEEFIPSKNEKYNNLHNAIVISDEKNYNENTLLFFIWLILFEMKKVFSASVEINSDNYYEKLLLDNPIRKILRRTGRGKGEVNDQMMLLKVLINNFKSVFDISGINPKKITEEKVKEYFAENKIESFLKLFEDDDVMKFLGINKYEGVIYYSKENFEDLLDWLFSLTVLKYYKKDIESGIKEENVESGKKKVDDVSKTSQIILHTLTLIRTLKKYSRESEYKMEFLLEKLQKFSGEESPKK